MHQRIQGERATLSRGGPAGAFAPLRVGLVVDSAVQPAWAARLVSEIEASAFARVVVLAAARCDARAEPLHRRLWRGLLHDLYLRLDEGFFPGDPDALAPTDLRPLLPGCPVVEVSPGDVERLRGHGLDIAIVLSRALRPADCARIARHGAWSLRGSTGSGAEAASGMLEVLRAEGSTAVEIDAWTAAGRRVVARSRGPTETVSVRCNRDRLFWKGSALLLRGLRDLAERGAVAADAAPPAPPLRKPTNLAMAGLFLGHAFRYARRKVLDLFTNEQWYPVYRFGDATGAPDDFTGLVEVMPPKDRYWADPFPVRTRDGRTFLFFEELRYKDPKGRILAMEIDREKGPGEPFPVLERDYHLSYPHVFEWQGQYYMVPESSQNGTVTLFRCVSFPDRWVEERDLLRGVHAVDATLEEVAGRWWMFVNVTAYGAGNRDELHLYHAETPLGPWTPHARNPVKSDCRGARPAGRLFRRDGQLFRPAQNCAGGYGSSIVVHRIDLLTTQAYVETQVAEIRPDWDPKARRAHTINRCDGFLVLDLLRRRSRF